MRLTNYIRDAFVRAAMQDVPKVDYEAQAHKLAHEAIASLFAKDFPGLDFEKAKKTGWIERRSVGMPYGINSIYTEAPSYDCLKDNKEVWSKLEDLNGRRSLQSKQRNELEEKLKGVAYACTTRKALAEALPEFEKYLPAEEGKPSRTLPAIANLVADFTKAGWPKAKEQKATA